MAKGNVTFCFGVVDSELEWAFHAPTSQLDCTPLGQSLHFFATFFGTHPPWSCFFPSPGAIRTLYLDSMLDNLENDTHGTERLFDFSW